MSYCFGILNRTQNHILARALAHLHVFGNSDEFAAHLVMHILMDVEPLQRSAGLAAIDEGAPEQPFGDLLRIDIGQHDASIVSPEFKGKPLHGFRRIHHDFLAGGAGTGENNLADPLMGRDCRSERVLSGNAIDHALRQHLVHDFHEPQRGQGRERRRLAHHGVARKDRGNAVPDRDHNRKIPGGDGPHDTERLAVQFDLALFVVLKDLHRQGKARRILGPGHSSADLPAGAKTVKGFALLGSQELSQFFRIFLDF